MVSIHKEQITAVDKQFETSRIACFFNLNLKRE